MQELTYDSLAPLYVLRKDLEETPDPFRLQGNKITFVVPFLEYQRFVKTNLRSADYLATPTKDLLMYIKTGDTVKLYASYLKDMAVAICKELHYAEAYNSDATHYMHKSDGDTYYDQEFMHKVTLQSNLQEQLRQYMSTHGFPLPKTFKSDNHPLWEYANTLYYFSYYGYNEWEVAL